MENSGNPNDISPASSNDNPGASEFKGMSKNAASNFVDPSDLGLLSRFKTLNPKTQRNYLMGGIAAVVALTIGVVGYLMTSGSNNDDLTPPMEESATSPTATEPQLAAPAQSAAPVAPIANEQQQPKTEQAAPVPTEPVKKAEPSKQVTKSKVAKDKKPKKSGHAVAKSKKSKASAKAKKGAMLTKAKKKKTKKTDK